MTWEHRLSTWAARHEGLVAQFHLPLAGCTSADWAAALRSGRWELRGQRVLAARAAPRSDAQRVLAAQYDAGPCSFLHWRTSLAWQGMREFDLRMVLVAVPRGRHETHTDLATIHRLRTVRAHDVIVVRGVAVETALRALWVEAGRYAAPHRRDLGLLRVGRLLDNANKLGIVTWAGLHQMVDDLQQRGRAGTVIMRALAEARPPGSSPTDSRNEDRFDQVLHDAGVERFRHQVHLGGEELIGRCDQRDWTRPLAIEINSELHHTTPSDVEADLVRYRRLNDAGFTVGVIWEADLWRRQAAVVRTTQRARVLAERGDCVVLHSPGCPWPRPLPPGHDVHR